MIRDLLSVIQKMFSEAIKNVNKNQRLTLSFFFVLLLAFIVFSQSDSFATFISRFTFTSNQSFLLLLALLLSITSVIFILQGTTIKRVLKQEPSFLTIDVLVHTPGDKTDGISGVDVTLSIRGINREVTNDKGEATFKIPATFKNKSTAISAQIDSYRSPVVEFRVRDNIQIEIPWAYKSSRNIDLIRDIDKKEAPNIPSKILNELKVQYCNLLMKELDSRNSPFIGGWHRSFIPSDINTEKIYININTDADFRVNNNGKYRGSVAALVTAIDNNSTVFYGNPGCGKSTFLVHMAKELASLILIDTDGKVPFMVSLGDFSQYIQSHSHPENQHYDLYNYTISKTSEFKSLDHADYIFSHLIKLGGVHFLLDGLDEIYSDQTKKRVVDIIMMFREMYPDNQFTITTRMPNTDFFRNLNQYLEGFTFYKIASLDQDKVNQFIDQWFEELDSSRNLSANVIFNKREGLKSNIKNNHLLSWAANPLQLTLMCIVYSEHDTLPGLDQIHKTIIHKMLNDWGGARNKNNPTIIEMFHRYGCNEDDIIDVLAKLAFLSFTDFGETQAREMLLKKEIANILSEMSVPTSTDWEEKAIREFVATGILLEDGNQYQFIHNSMRKYLASIALSKKPDFLELIQKLAEKEDPWCDIIIMAFINRINNGFDEQQAGQIMEYLTKRYSTEKDWHSICLGGEFAVQIKNSGKVFETKIIDAIKPYIKEYLIGQPDLASIPHLTHILKAIGDPRFSAGNLHFPDDDQLGFVHIPEGVFWMGSAKDEPGAKPYEKEIHELYIPSFYISKYPITVAQYKHILNKYRDNFAGFQEQSNNPGLFEADNMPIRNVSWYVAKDFCQGFQRALIEGSCPPNQISALLKSGDWIVELPSEAEWEKVVRGGDKRIYPWGNHEAVINRGELLPVGVGVCHNPYGVHNMGGYLWEWTRSIFGRDRENPVSTYPYKPYQFEAFDSNDVKNDVHVVVRGGSYDKNEKIFLRCAHRYGCKPYLNPTEVGFRLVITKRI